MSLDEVIRAYVCCWLCHRHVRMSSVRTRRKTKPDYYQAVDRLNTYQIIWSCKHRSGTGHATYGEADMCAHFRWYHKELAV